MFERLLRKWALIVSLLGLVAAPQGMVQAVSRQGNSAYRAVPVAAEAYSSQTDIPPEFEQVAENALFTLYANPTTVAFKVRDRRSGYVWHSNLDQPQEGDRFNRPWLAFAQSGISIEYLDERGIDRRISITNANHTLEYRAVEQGFEAFIHFTDFGIGLQLIVRLEEDGVQVQVPFTFIRQDDPAFRLGKLYLYPFMGATRNDEISGYIFIPDGSGSLIPLAASTKARTMFTGRYYGSDLGMIGVMPWDPNIIRPHRLSLPVMGMVHGVGENAFIAIVEDGAAFAELHVHPAGVITNFNFAYNAFVFNESYFQATNRAGAGVTILQRETNAFDIKVRYRFLTGEQSDYVGMARSYQQYLLDKGMLNRRVNPGDDIGIRLEFLGGDKERVLLWYRMVPMTTVEQMKAILDDLQIRQVRAVYYGWQPLGASSSLGSSLRLDRRLGSLAELQTLARQLETDGGRLYLYADLQAALFGEGDYSRRDLAMAITGVHITGYNRGKGSYYLNADALRSRMSRLAQQISQRLSAGLAQEQVGAILYSDFRNPTVVNREQTLRLYQQMLAELPIPQVFYNPNAYVFGWMDAYFDMPLGDSGYRFTSQSVPYLQIVLAGYVPFYGTPLNFSSNLQIDRLRHADYGVYPSFFLTHELTARMLNTSSRWIFTSAYSQWGDEVKATYAWLNHLLAPAVGQTVVARQNLAEGVYATTYANGYQVIVNYNDQPFHKGELVVPAQDALGGWGE